MNYCLNFESIFQNSVHSIKDVDIKGKKLDKKDEVSTSHLTKFKPGQWKLNWNAKKDEIQTILWYLNSMTELISVFYKDKNNSFELPFKTNE